MKKVFFVIVIAAIFSNCTSDMDDSIMESPSNEGQNALNFKEIVDDKYDGEILRFKDDNDFVEFYDLLTNASQSDFNDFLTIKDGNNSSLYRDLFKDEEVKEGETNDTGYSETESPNELMVSEYLSSIFNYENKIIIDNTIVSLDGSGNLVSLGEKGDKSTIIGGVNKPSDQATDGSSRHNVNYSKSWLLYTSSTRKTFFYIFNETVYINNVLSSSKVFYRKKSQYKSCSFWRCTWKSDNTPAMIRPNLIMFGDCNFDNLGMNDYEIAYSSVFTKNILNYNFSIPCALGQTIYIRGSVSYTRENTPLYVFSNLLYDFNPY